MLCRITDLILSAFAKRSLRSFSAGWNGGSICLQIIGYFLAWSLGTIGLVWASGWLVGLIQ